MQICMAEKLMSEIGRILQTIFSVVDEINQLMREIQKGSKLLVK